jgi:hypothetical protein|tara:strand:+ start:578 stop:853 length:276 start_codon:yes stop_codon:yes gene_type:complete
MESKIRKIFEDLGFSIIPGESDSGWDHYGLTRGSDGRHPEINGSIIENGEKGVGMAFSSNPFEGGAYTFATGRLVNEDEAIELIKEYARRL